MRTKLATYEHRTIYKRLSNRNSASVDVKSAFSTDSVFSLVFSVQEVLSTRKEILGGKSLEKKGRTHKRRQQR